MNTTLMEKAFNNAGLQHGETWFAWITRGNILRMADFRQGKPHTRKYDNTGRNIETTDTSVGYILNPGTKDGRDEQHAIRHLVRCLAVFGHGRVPVTETSNALRTALSDELAYCREIGLPHRAIADYARALDDFMDVAYYTQTPYLLDEKFAAALDANANALINARHALSVAADEEDGPVSAVVVGFSADAKGAIRKEADRIIRAVRSEGTMATDPRSVAERRLIDRAVALIVHRRDVQGLNVVYSACINQVWKKCDGIKAFTTLKKFDNAVRYDLKNFYDPVALLACVKAHPPC